MNQQKEFLGTAPVGKLLLKLAIPTVTAQLINMLYNIVDRIYIGHMPEVGDLALTGVGVCMPIILIVSAFAALVASGGAPRASIYMGKGEHTTAEKILGGCFTLQIAMSVILTAILLIWNRPLLLAFGASAQTIEYAVDYMNIYAAGTLFVQLTLGMNAFISAQGFTGVSMVSVMIGAISNIILDPIFIYGFDMGVKGAALATILSQMVSCVWILSFLFGKRAVLHLKKENLFVSPKIILPCIALGAASFVMQASESIISICFNTSLQQHGSAISPEFGDTAVGAMTVMVSVMQIAMLPLQGVAQGAQPILSYNYGAKNKERVVATFRLLLVCSLIYSFTLWAAIMAFPRVFAAIFTPDPAFIAFTAKHLRIYFAVLCIFGIQVACQMTFVSLGNAPASILVAVVRKFVLLLPLIYLVPTFTSNKVLGVYLAEPIADFIAVSFTAILFYFEFRKALKKLDAPTV